MSVVAERAEVLPMSVRSLMSEAAWKVMAARAERTEQLRLVNEARRTTELEAADIIGIQ